jgi:hypothetical protein
MRIEDDRRRLDFQEIFVYGAFEKRDWQTQDEDLSHSNHLHE